MHVRWRFNPRVSKQLPKRGPSHAPRSAREHRGCTSGTAAELLLRTPRLHHTLGPHSSGCGLSDYLTSSLLWSHRSSWMSIYSSYTTPSSVLTKRNSAHLQLNQSAMLTKAELEWTQNAPAPKESGSVETSLVISGPNGFTWNQDCPISLPKIRTAVSQVPYPEQGSLCYSSLFTLILPSERKNTQLLSRRRNWIANCREHRV